jgi:hypothetical protein
LAELELTGSLLCIVGMTARMRLWRQSDNPICSTKVSFEPPLQIDTSGRLRCIYADHVEPAPRRTVSSGAVDLCRIAGEQATMKDNWGYE